MQRTIFYSWQSDLNGATNRSFIEKSLKNVAKAITGDASIQFEASVDRDTAGLAGSPDIAGSIFSKINKADIFVADISIVNSKQEGRKTPNPNVLIELGYAINALGFDRILLIFNTEYGSIEDLPFDLRSKRVMSYRATVGEADRSVTRIAFEKQLDQAVRLSFLQHASEPDFVQSTAFQSVDNASPKRHIIVKAELNKLLEELVKLEPKKMSSGSSIDDLYTALKDTIPYYLEFAKLTELAVLLNDEITLRVIYQWFGVLFERTNRLSDFHGGIFDGDFDFFRFLTHEFMVTFAGFLLNGQHLELLINYLKTPITVNYLQVENGPGEVYFYYAAQWTHRLWEQNQIVQKYSAHGYLLKQRHSLAEIADIVPFKDFMAADYFLYLYDQVAVRHNNGDRYKWMAWSSPNLNETPIFLKRIERIDAAEQFVTLFNLGGIEDLREAVRQSTLKLSNAFHHGRMDLFFRVFDFNKIGTKS